MKNIKKQLEAMNDDELLQLAKELTQTSHGDDTIIRKLYPNEESGQFMLHIINVSAELTQVLADRLKEELRARGVDDL